VKLYFTDQLCRLADNTILVGLCYHSSLSYHCISLNLEGWRVETHDTCCVRCKYS